MFPSACEGASEQNNASAHKASRQHNRLITSATITANFFLHYLIKNACQILQKCHFNFIYLIRAFQVRNFRYGTISNHNNKLIFKLFTLACYTKINGFGFEWSNKQSLRWTKPECRVSSINTTLFKFLRLNNEINELL